MSHPHHCPKCGALQFGSVCAACWQCIQPKLSIGIDLAPIHSTAVDSSYAVTFGGQVLSVIPGSVKIEFPGKAFPMEVGWLWRHNLQSGQAAG